MMADNHHLEKSKNELNVRKEKQQQDYHTE